MKCGIKKLSVLTFDSAQKVLFILLAFEAWGLCEGIWSSVLLILSAVQCAF